MSEDATYRLKRTMDCDVVARDDVPEKYLTGRLDAEDREAFEEHYLGCSRCFDDLRALRAIRDELRHGGVELPSRTARQYWTSAPAAAAAAAVLVAAIGLLVWTRPPPPALPPAATTASSPSEAQAPEPPATRQPRASPPASRPSLAQLARVDPPQFEPLKLRGIPDAATERFRRGMEHYQKGDYRAAIDHLRAADELDPDAAHITFFLGVSYLMIEARDAAVDRLRATIALGDSPYLDEAHFYLAKAFLGRGDVSAAETHLNEVVRTRGRLSGEAGRVLNQLQRLKSDTNPGQGPYS